MKEAEAETEALRVANESLREASSAANNRMERTLEALKIAGQNAANARADANAAESFAASLAHQVESLRSTVEETKRSTQQVYQEHEQIASAARSVESNLISREMEFSRKQKEQEQTLLEYERMKRKCEELATAQKMMKYELEQKSNHTLRLQQEVDEKNAMENARKNRVAMVEKELREARSLLVETSSTQSETEATAVVLRDTINELKAENKTLHDKMADEQAKFRSDKDAQLLRLTNAEKDSQNLRVQASAHDDKIKRIQAEKTSAEKQINSLKTRISNLERRLFSKDLMHSPDSSKEPPETPDVASPASRDFVIPSLTPASKTSSGDVSKSTCTICSKSSKGVMKSCQCGRDTCNKRAHATCIAASGVTSSTGSNSMAGGPNRVILCSVLKR